LSRNDTIHVEMKNLGGNMYELEKNECLTDHWDPSAVIKAPDTVRNTTFEDEGQLFQKFQGSSNSIVVSVRANTPEDAVTSCGQERK